MSVEKDVSRPADPVEERCAGSGPVPARFDTDGDGDEHRHCTAPSGTSLIRGLDKGQGPSVLPVLDVRERLDSFVVEHKRRWQNGHALARDRRPAA